MVLFADQIFKNLIRQKARPSVCFKTCVEFFKHYSIEFLKSYEKTKSLTKSLKKFLRVIEKLGHVFAL